MKKLFFMFGIAAALTMQAAATARPSYKCNDKAVLEAYINNPDNRKDLRDEVKTQLELKCNKKTYTYEDQKAAVRTYMGDTPDAQLRYAWDNVSFRDEAWNEFSKATTNQDILGYYYMLYPDKYVVPASQWFSRMLETTSPAAAKEYCKNLPGQLNKLSDEEAVKQLKKLNRQYSAYLTGDRKAEWEPVVSTVRTLLQTY